MHEKHVVFIPCHKIMARDYDYMLVKRVLFCVSIFRMLIKVFVFQDHTYSKSQRTFTYLGVCIAIGVK